MAVLFSTVEMSSTCSCRRRNSSIKRGQPATFGVSQVIPGWVEALQLMPEGAKWKLYIPSELAYGAQGAGEMIPPHSTLIFEVELLKVLNK